MGSAGVKMNGDAAYRQRKRARMFQQQDGLCYHCKKPMTLEKRPNPPFPNYATFDHLVPQALGGSGRVENICLACYDCNQTFGAALSRELSAAR